MADDQSRAGHGYLSPSITEFVNRTHARHDPGLQAAFTAPERHGIPPIMLGPAEGRTLELLCRLAGVTKAVEIGTLAGYSGIWIARALRPEGKLWTLEIDPVHAEIAREALTTAGLADRVEVCVGDALDTLATLQPEGPFDAVFIDADKARYDQYGSWAAQNLRPGGLLVGDNSYLFGRVLAEEPAAVAMRRFHEEAARWFHSACIPTPDGLVVGIRNDEPFRNS